MKKALLPILFLMVFDICCPMDRWTFIFIQNNSAFLINAIPSYTYPDTALPTNKSELISVEPNQKNSMEKFGEWETTINNLPSKTLSIFILNADTVNAYPWDTIRSQNNILKRYDRTVAQLKQSNWTVTYP
jgi:hypothetical protein